jgi:hypothetical protein
MDFFSPINGGGTGGGPDVGDQTHSFDGNYSIMANQVSLLSRPPMPPAIPGPYVISILAAGMCMDGIVDVRGSQGVRISAGPPPALATNSSSTQGVDIEISDLGKFKLQRGLIPPATQTIEAAVDGIKINGGSGKVTIESLTEITLSVAGGTSKIKLGPEGVTIEGMMVSVKGQIQTQIQGVMVQVKGDGMTQISGGITMIG